LHVDHITKLALERGLIETTGSTPEKTMSTEIRRDIKKNHNSSAFRLIENAVFSLNPTYTEERQRLDERQEIDTKRQLESERITAQYIGRAGEHLIVNELLFRGYNASIMSVDEGLDVTATKGEKLFNIQAKTSNENKFNKHVFNISISSFEKHQSNNIYYIFVIRGNLTNFLIFPYHIIQKGIDQSNITETSNRRYKVEVSINSDKFYLGKNKEDVTYYKNNWGLIK
jgi:hypothetical protein